MNIINLLLPKLILLLIFTPNLILANEKGLELAPYEIKYDNLNESTTLKIPDQCTEFLELNKDNSFYNSHDAATLKQHEKAANDCSFYQFISNGNPKPGENYLGNYDFFNASLTALPFDIECNLVVGTVEFNEFCSNLKAHNSNYNYIDIRLAEYSLIKDKIYIPESYRKFNISPTCKLTNGRFFGKIYTRDNIINCELEEQNETTNSSATGFKITNIAYRDMNHDNIQDVILNIKGIGNNTISKNIILTLSRTSFKDKFFIVR